MPAVGVLARLGGFKLLSVAGAIVGGRVVALAADETPEVGTPK